MGQGLAQLRFPKPALLCSAPPHLEGPFTPSPGLGAETRDPGWCLKAQAKLGKCSSSLQLGTGSIA